MNEGKMTAELFERFRNELESGDCFTPDQINTLNRSVIVLLDGLSLILRSNQPYPPAPSFESWIKK